MATIVDPRWQGVLEQSYGTSIKEAEIMLLGHPITLQIPVSASDVDVVGAVYCHALGDDSQGVTIVLNPSGMNLKHLIPTTPVRVKKVGNDYELVGLAGRLALEFLHGVALAEQSQVELAQLMFGVAQPTQPASMRLIIRGAPYHVGGTLYATVDQYTVDFSDSPLDVEGDAIDIPTVNLKAIGVLIQIDPSMGTLSYKQGAQFDSELSHVQALNAGYYPQKNSGFFSVAYARLVKGITMLTGKQIYNVPEFLNSGFNADTIVTDLYGNIMVDSFGNVVTTG